MLSDWGYFRPGICSMLPCIVREPLIAELAGLDVAGFAEATYVRRPPGADMDLSARLAWHSKGLLKERFLSMDLTRICSGHENRRLWETAHHFLIQDRQLLGVKYKTQETVFTPIVRFFATLYGQADRGLIYRIDILHKRNLLGVANQLIPAAPLMTLITSKLA